MGIIMVHREEGQLDPGPEEAIQYKWKTQKQKQSEVKQIK